MVLIYGIAARYDFTDQLKKIYFDFGLNLTKVRIYSSWTMIVCVY